MSKERQSYQEVSDIIERNLLGLYKLGVRELNEINLKECKGDYHDYFFYRKNKYPKKYERLMFDTNGHKPFCEDLGQIMMDFILCGFLDCGKIMSSQNIKDIEHHINFEKPRIEKIFNIL